MKLATTIKFADWAFTLIISLSLGALCLRQTACLLQKFLVLTALYIVYSTCIIAYNVYWHPLASYPGPRPRAALHFPDAYAALRGTSIPETKALHDQYGHVVRIAPNTLSYNNAQAWKDIYTLRPDRSELQKDPFHYRQTRSSVHILNADTHQHRRLRKLIAPGFSEKALAEQESLLDVHFDLLVSKLRSQINAPSALGRVDLMSYYYFVTFDVIGDLVLGEPFGALQGEVYHQWMRNFFESMKLLGILRFAATYPLANIFLALAYFASPSLAAKRKAQLAFTEEKVSARLHQNCDRKDIMTSILQHNTKTNHQPLTDREIVSNARILLAAGSDTTATNLSGATWLLLTHPDVLHRAQLEVRTTLKTAQDITLQNTTDEKKLPYLNAAIREVLRFYPSVPSSFPRVTGPDGAMIDGRFVPGMTTVGVHQWSTYRSRDNFALPDEFRPERWLRAERGAVFDDDVGEAMQPFTMGPRICLGKSLALAEIRSVLVRMLWHFDMQLDERSRDWIDQKGYMFWEKPPLWVVLKNRGDN